MSLGLLVPESEDRLKNRGGGGGCDKYTMGMGGRQTRAAPERRLSFCPSVHPSMPLFRECLDQIPGGKPWGKALLRPPAGVTQRGECAI